MEYIKYLSKDARLKPIIKKTGILKINKKKKVYLHLCSSIMSQQLSTKVARVFHKRFLDLYGDQEPTPEQIIDTPFEKLRAIGLSNAKATYVQNVCRFFIEQKITDKKLYQLSNEEVIALLTQIKGVGKWTVEMILMFTLGREDVFAIDDLGLQQAVIGLYDLKHRDKKIMRNKILKISEQWAPYRTYACMYLWRWKDNKPEIE
ncbi:MAG TPA: DNA-3-methyladenine glycosylase 2 family protein [Chitinophagaceae bacterium]|nr:DNA-3-methyladenine glycosylase 2 family protein [Chitinophagaceae bacterium]